MTQWACGRNALMLAALALWAVSAHLASAGIGPADLRVAVAVTPLCVAGAVLAWQVTRPWLAVGALTVAVALALASSWGALRTHLPWLYYLQHLGVHLALAAWFARSLAPGRIPMVSAMARLIARAPLTPRALRYTRAVTWAWALFLVGNAAASTLLFAWAPVAVWSVYANLLTAPLIAVFFGLELAVRVCVLPRNERPTLKDVLQAWRAHRAAPVPLDRWTDRPS